MPWTEKPGENGANGSVERGPWGKNGGDKGSTQPPDLEDLLKSGKERFKRAMPGQGGDGRAGPPRMQMNTIFIVAACLVVGLWMYSGVYRVSAGEVAVVTTLGKYSSIQSPGLRWHIPYPVQYRDIVNVSQERSIPIGDTAASQSEGSMLTSDLNIVDISINVVWRVKEVATGPLPGAAEFLFNTEEPERLVKAVAESALREVVGRNEFEPITTAGRSIVPNDTQLLMQEMLDSYQSGVQIVRVTFQKADPPAQVRDAYIDRINARNDAEEKINSANRYANEIVPRARGEARKLVLESEAYAARVVLEARGDVARFNDIYAEYAKAPEVTRRRMYLETMEQVLAKTDTVIIDTKASGAVPYLSLNELMKNKTVKK